MPASPNRRTLSDAYRMRAPLAGFVDDVALVRDAEIEQFRRQQNGGNNDVCVPHK